MGVQLVADPVNRRVRSLADQGFQVLGCLLGSLGFRDQDQVLLLQSVDLLCVAADLDVVGGGQLFKLVDGLREGLEDLVELDHAGLVGRQDREANYACAVSWTGRLGRDAAVALILSGAANYWVMHLILH